MAHHRIKKKEIRDRHHAGRKGEAAMSPMQIKDKDPVEGKVYGDRGQSDEHRHIAFIQSVKRGREHLIGRVSGEANGVINNYNNLSATQKNRLIAFLNTL